MEKKQRRGQEVPRHDGVGTDMAQMPISTAAARKASLGHWALWCDRSEEEGLLGAWASCGPDLTGDGRA